MEIVAFFIIGFVSMFVMSLVLTGVSIMLKNRGMKKFAYRFGMAADYSVLLFILLFCIAVGLTCFEVLVAIVDVAAKFIGG